MALLLVEVVTDVEVATILTKISDLKALLPFLVNLTAANRKKLRKTGTKREGYVKDVYETVMANISALPDDFDSSDWTKVRTLRTQLIQIRNSLLSLFESLDDTILLLGNEEITFADGGYGFLKQSAKGNTPLTISTERISKTFDGQGRKGQKTTFSVPASGNVVVTDVAITTQFLNSGTTPLVVLASSAIGKFAPQTVAAGTALKLSAAYKTITVTNQTTVVGEFSVKLKS